METMVVLHGLRDRHWRHQQLKDARRFHVYVGNRVQHIRDHSTPEEWNHVLGRDNPSDGSSRGATAKELLENQRWFGGPQFLLQSDPHLSLTEPATALSTSDVEVKKEVSTLATQVGKVCPAAFGPNHFERVSSFNRLKRAIVRIQRMIEMQRPNKKHNWRPKEGPSLVDELNQTEKLIIKGTQQHHFREEIKTLCS